MKKIPTYFLNLAGEYRVCSELNKRQVFATVTYGTRKGADVYAISDRKSRTLKIEVKTSQKRKFVTSLSQKAHKGGLDPNARGFWKQLSKDKGAPDFWVLVHIQRGDNESYRERFFVLSHAEICRAQAAQNASAGKRYQTKYGKLPDFSKGVDNVALKNVEQFEDQWDKIVKALGGKKAGV